MPAHLAHRAGESRGRAELSADDLQCARGIVIRIQRVTQTFRKAHPTVLTRSLPHFSACAWLGGAGYLK